MIRRREFLIGAGAAAIAGPAVVRADDTIVIKMGALKLIHAIAPISTRSSRRPATRWRSFRSRARPTARTRWSPAVDIGMFGIAAAMLGAAAGEPIVVIASACNKRHGGDRRRRIRHQLDQGSQGQEGRDLAGLDAGGRHPRAAAHGRHDDQGHPAGPRLLQRHAARARARRHRCLCRRRAGPGVSLANGIGKLVEYPYATPMGSLNMVFGATRNRHEKTRSSSSDPRHPPQGGPNYAMGNPARWSRWRSRSSAQKQRSDRDFGAQRRADLEDRRPEIEQSQDLRLAHAGTEADQAAARFRDLLRHAASSTAMEKAA